MCARETYYTREREMEREREREIHTYRERVRARARERERGTLHSHMACTQKGVRGVVWKTPRTSFAHPWPNSLHQAQKAACCPRADAGPGSMRDSSGMHCTDTDSALMHQIIFLKTRALDDARAEARSRPWNTLRDKVSPSLRPAGDTQITIAACPTTAASLMLVAVAASLRRAPDPAAPPRGPIWLPPRMRPPATTSRPIWPRREPLTGPLTLAWIPKHQSS